MDSIDSAWDLESGFYEDGNEHLGSLTARQS
jgi:hypothetical protein